MLDHNHSSSHVAQSSPEVLTSPQLQPHTSIQPFLAFLPPFCQELPWQNDVSGCSSLLCSLFPASWVLARTAVAAGRTACWSHGGLWSAGGFAGVPPAGRRAPRTKEVRQKQGRRYQKGQGGCGEVKTGREQHLASTSSLIFTPLVPRSCGCLTSTHPAQVCTDA